MVYVASSYNPAETRDAIRSLQARARAIYRARHPRRGKAADRVAALEEGFAGQALLHQAILRLCLSKKRFTRKAYLKSLEGADRLDGEADGSLPQPGAAKAEGGDPGPKKRKAKRGRRRRKRT
ncbi:MAG: hypothetical protein ACYS47_00325 [Planctomycetota bacterium]